MLSTTNFIWVHEEKKNFGFLWEFWKHLPSYQPLKILTASRKLGYFFDHIDHSNRQIVVTVSPWSPARLAALMLGSVELNHMRVGGKRAGVPWLLTRISQTDWGTQAEQTWTHKGKWMLKEPTMAISHSNLLELKSGITEAHRLDSRVSRVTGMSDHSHLGSSNNLRWVVEHVWASVSISAKCKLECFLIESLVRMNEVML